MRTGRAIRARRMTVIVARKPQEFHSLGGFGDGREAGNMPYAIHLVHPETSGGRDVA